MSHYTIDELNKRILDAKDKVSIGAKYFHYKNPDNYYIIQGLCLIEATDEVGVLYKPLYLSDTEVVWMRPLENFLSEVDVNGKAVKRFQEVN